MLRRRSVLREWRMRGERCSSRQLHMLERLALRNLYGYSGQLHHRLHGLRERSMRSVRAKRGRAESLFIIL